uniref:RING-CH-type domain-containing protein n=1 Tax=Plectus sambesii TaxID=2011161 RepID=A0A914XDS7_9BILA
MKFAALFLLERHCRGAIFSDYRIRTHALFKMLIVPSNTDHSADNNVLSKGASELTLVGTVVPSSLTSSTPQHTVTHIQKAAQVSKGSRFCRICLSKRGHLLRPCACSGSIADVHEVCLHAWMEKRGKQDKCEVCLETYQIVGKDKRSNPIWSWVVSSLSVLTSKSTNSLMMDDDELDLTTLI